MSEPLRILCLNYEYPPVGGGGGRVAHRINAELARRGHAVRVQTAGLRHLPARETVDGVEIFRAESFRRKEDTCTVPEMALYLATSFRPALRLVREWRPHVIHAHFAVPTGALAWAVSRLTGTPYVLTAHLGDVPGGVPEQTAGLFRFVQPFTRPIWRRAAAVTAVSTFVADLAERAYHRRPEVVLNGIPSAPNEDSERGKKGKGEGPETFPFSPFPALETPPRLLMVGRLSVQKNPLLAIRALALVRDRPWELRVIGDGPLRAEMEREVRANDLAARIRFLGWLDAPAVGRAMSDADALLISSRSEGLPMAAIEALSHGLAIVSTRIGGVADIVEDGANGLLAEPTAESFAAALRKILTDPRALPAMRRASAARASRFDLPVSVDAYEAILRRHSRAA